MKKVGLIGFPLKNSFSENYFNTRFKERGMAGYVYTNYALSSVDELPELLAHTPELIGFNVTIPHKQAIIPILDKLDETAKAVGAVNCVKRDIVTGKLTGYNTDVYGFEQSVLPYFNRINKALILGTGGAAKAVAYVLQKNEIPFYEVSRDPKQEQLGYDQLTESILTSHELIINCTPVGMFPDINGAPGIPYHLITQKHIAYDLIYLPAETKFLKNCKAQGATIHNGLDMLHLQADKSWELWNLDLG